MPLRNRTALITGGSRGIGKGIAKDWRTKACASPFPIAPIKPPPSHAALAAGARRRMFCRRSRRHRSRKIQFLVDKVVERFGRLDILVNNVGEFNWKTVAETVASTNGNNHRLKSAQRVLRQQGRRCPRCAASTGDASSISARSAPNAHSARAPFPLMPPRRPPSFPFRARWRSKKPRTASP